MNFYHILYGLKTNGFNRNLTWYENLFVKFYNTNLGKLIAKFLKIKGNTVSFNQLVQNGNFADTSGWTSGAGSISASNNILTLSATGAEPYVRYTFPKKPVANHKYYVTAKVVAVSGSLDKISFLFTSSGQYKADFNVNGINGKYSAIIGNGNFAIDLLTIWVNNRSSTDVTQFSNVMIHDLTLMGIDNLTTVAEVEAWLSSHIGNLPYYAYTQGKLLPFKGESLKTTGKNLVEKLYSGSIDQNGGIAVSTNRVRTEPYIRVIPSQTYTISATSNNPSYSTVYIYARYFSANDGSLNVLTEGWFALPRTITIPDDANYIGIAVRFGNTVPITTDDISNFQIELGSSASSYEPYTENTINLPTLDYFPSGMKSAGSVYDELTPTGYVKRIGMVDMGTLEWRAGGSGVSGKYRMVSNTIGNIKYPTITSQIANIKCAVYESASADSVYGGAKGISLNNIGEAAVFDNNYSSASSPSDFKTAMSGVYLYYELATPTEVTIDPPLDLSYEIEWGGTEQLLPENTSVPVTSPILADMHYPDGDRTDQEFTYRQINKELVNKNTALSTMLGRSVWTDEPDEPLDVLLKGE